jgi:hypothetical protein
MIAWHFGQRIFLPAEFSGALSFVPHPMHWTTFAMRASGKRCVAPERCRQEEETDRSDRSVPSEERASVARSIERASLFLSGRSRSSAAAGVCYGSYSAAAVFRGFCGQGPYLPGLEANLRRAAKAD